MRYPLGYTRALLSEIMSFDTNVPKNSQASECSVYNQSSSSSDSGAGGSEGGRGGAGGESRVAETTVDDADADEDEAGAEAEEAVECDDITVLISWGCT